MRDQVEEFEMLLDDVLRDVEIVLPEGTRRIMHRRPAKMFHHAFGSALVLEIGTEDGIRALAIGIEPQAVQL